MSGIELLFLLGLVALIVYGVIFLPRSKSSKTGQLFKELQVTLGGKLEKKKMPFDMLPIDRWSLSGTYKGFPYEIKEKIMNVGSHGSEYLIEMSISIDCSENFAVYIKNMDAHEEQTTKNQTGTGTKVELEFISQNPEKAKDFFSRNEDAMMTLMSLIPRFEIKDSKIIFMIRQPSEAKDIPNEKKLILELLEKSLGLAKR